MIPAVAPNHKHHFETTQPVWKHCEIREYVNHTKVLAIYDQKLFVNTLDRLRVCDLTSGEWSICRHNKQIYAIANGVFLFAHSLHNESMVKAFPLNHTDFSNELVKVPEWVMRLQYCQLSDGTRLVVFLSRQKVEVRDATGQLRFQYSNHNVEEITHNDSKFVKETGIISSFDVYKDKYKEVENPDRFVVGIVDKLCYKHRWKEFDYSIYYRRYYDRRREIVNPDTKKPNDYCFIGGGSDLKEPIGPEIEHWLGLKFNLQGEEIGTVADHGYGRIYPSSQTDVFESASEQILNDSEMHHQQYGPWQSFWANTHLVLYHTKSQKKVIDQGYREIEKRGYIQEVFFSGEELVILRYDRTLDQNESGFSYCSGPTVYDRDIEYRHHYRLEFLGFDGTVKATIPLDLKQEIDHLGYNSPIPKMIAANRHRVVFKTPEGTFEVEELSPKKRMTLSNVITLNDKYVISRGAIFNLLSGEQKIIPWHSEVALSGDFLATFKDKKVTVVNLANNAQVDITCHSTPKRFVSFQYTDQPDDFIALQCEKCIEVWHRTV